MGRTEATQCRQGCSSLRHCRVAIGPGRGYLFPYSPVARVDRNFCRWTGNFGVPVGAYSLLGLRTHARRNRADQDSSSRRERHQGYRIETEFPDHRSVADRGCLLCRRAVCLVWDNTSLFENFTAVPIQIYNWTVRPSQQGFQVNASAAIIVLMVAVLAMNLLAAVIRERFRQT